MWLEGIESINVFVSPCKTDCSSQYLQTIFLMNFHCSINKSDIIHLDKLKSHKLVYVAIGFNLFEERKRPNC